MNIADQIELVLLPVWIIDPAEINADDLRPGAIVQVQHVDCIRPIGAPPVWEWARRVIEGADA